MANKIPPTDEGIFAELEARENERKAREIAEKDLDNAILFVMNTKQGRDFLRWCIGFTMQDESISTSDPYLIQNLSGRRDVGLQILSRISSLCPDAYDLMMKEKRECLMKS